MFRSSRGKLLGLRSLKALRGRWKSSGKRVVFTNGVFDILHPGHVSLLERARALGDVLIVGLNTDASVRMLGKGPERPVNAFRERAAVLCGLASVDAVVGFSHRTPAALLKAVRPDILVKGADYKPGEVAGAEYAGRVRLLSLLRGHSTTAILRRLGV